MEKIKVGFAMCGSFCTFKKTLEIMEELKNKGMDIYPIMSENAFCTDTRFGKASDINTQVKNITGNEIISTISSAEPIGPKKLLDILLVEPCTGNTLAKLANGITDTSVTMAVKAHLRNNKPVLIAVSTNDALSTSAQNIGKLMSRRNIFFVPFKQDDYIKKPTSAVADFSLTYEAIMQALDNKQLEPLIE